MQRPSSHRCVSIAILILFAPTWGCQVAAYERETLARRDMAFGTNPELSAGEEHARAYREGSSGGDSVASGGCGCN